MSSFFSRISWPDEAQSTHRVIPCLPPATTSSSGPSGQTHTLDNPAEISLKGKQRVAVLDDMFVPFHELLSMLDKLARSPVTIAETQAHMLIGMLFILPPSLYSTHANLHFPSFANHPPLPARQLLYQLLTDGRQNVGWLQVQTRRVEGTTTHTSSSLSHSVMISSTLFPLISEGT